MHNRQSQEEIKELKCTCNQCGHKWHYLESEEKLLKKQAAANAMIGCGMCCNPFGVLFANKASDLAREGQKFSKCPKCGTGDIDKETICYDKKN